MTKNFLVGKDSKVLKNCLKMCQCQCVCARAHAPERDLLHSTLTPAPLTCIKHVCPCMHPRARVCMHAHTHTNTRGLTIFYISLNCNNMRHFITTITFQSKVITLVVRTLNLSFVTSELIQSLCL
jgi:hypothetical protein